MAAIADPVDELARTAGKCAPDAEVCSNLEELLALDLDGVVIATPSALHATQAIGALEAGVAVFCQKPLARNAEETARVLQAARRADRLLGVDFSYRFLDETRAIRDLVQTGQLGEIFAAELVFHNAYGPDKPWFYDRGQSGGGCAMDLGIHLVDLAGWILGCYEVSGCTSRLFAGGRPWVAKGGGVEDFATARLDMKNGVAVQVACSWKLSAGCDAVISGSFYGTKGGAGFRNVNGSFYEFVGERFEGTKRLPLACTADPWGGRAIIDWARQLARSPGYNPEIESTLKVARMLDLIYETQEPAS